MDITLILISLALAAWLGIMALALLLPFWPGILRVTQFLVCPTDCEMKVERYVYSYHRPGQSALGVYYLDQNRQRHEIKGRALLVFWLMCSVIASPVAYLIMVWAAPLFK